jgi:hypothetical protein
MRCKLREIARFLIQYRRDSNYPNGKLEDFIIPTKFLLLLASVKNVAGFVDHNFATRQAKSANSKLANNSFYC